MANVGQLPTHKCKREDGLLLRQCCLSSAACNGVDTEATRHALLGPARAVYMELPFEFPSVDDTDDSDSDFEVQPFQFSTVDDEGVLYARLHKGEVLAGGDRRPLMETTVTEGFPLASPTPGGVRVAAAEELAIPATQLADFQLAPASQPRTEVQLAGLDSLQSLNLESLLLRLHSQSSTSAEAASYLNLPPPEALFADLDISKQQMDWDLEESEVVSPETQTANLAGEDDHAYRVEKAESHLATPGPADAVIWRPVTDAVSNHRQTSNLVQSADPPTVFVDLRPGYSQQLEEEAEDDMSEVLSSASEGEIAGLAAEVHNWRKERSRLKLHACSVR